MLALFLCAVCCVVVLCLGVGASRHGCNITVGDVAPVVGVDGGAVGRWFRRVLWLWCARCEGKVGRIAKCKSVLI